MPTGKKRAKREPGSGSMVEQAKGVWYCAPLCRVSADRFARLYMVRERKRWRP